MKIVIDTNVVISGVFFGGAPMEVLKAVLNGSTDAFATVEITEEYKEIAEEMVERKQGTFRSPLFQRIIDRLHVIKAETIVDVCRDPDDNKFLSCAVDAKALYIVSGDKDLLSLEQYENVEIITAHEFCLRYLSADGK